MAGRNQRPVVIGIAGGSGSGKTAVTNAIYNKFREQSILVLEQDFYYKDQQHISMEERALTNYDHPLAFDNDLLLKHIEQLVDGERIEKPVYDYTLHTRSNKVIRIEPKDVIIVEGILILEDERLRNVMDIKLFVETDADIRIIRRMVRDIKERGRSIESVIDQYVSIVRPMHMQFIEPTKRYADIIIPEGGENNVAIDIIATKIQTILEENVIL
jgi:uridine kinase